MSTASPPQGGSVRWTLLGVMLAMLLAMLDNTIVGTALPTIVNDLGGLEHISWVATAYALAMAISTPVWAKAGDLFSRKNVFLVSIVVFLAASTLVGAAWSMPSLIGFRALQGLGAGGLVVGAVSIVGALVPPRQRTRYQGMTTAVMVVGTIAGPLMGGLITDQLDWRWAFYINLPLGLLALAWCWRMLHLPATRTKVTIDYAGIIALAVSIASLVFIATWGGVTYAWTSAPILGLAVLAVAALAVFLVVERRAADPVIPLAMFRNRNFTFALVLALVTGVVNFAAVLYVPMFQQRVQGVTASFSGLLLMPMLGSFVVTGQIAGRLMGTTGRYKIFPVLGTVSLTAGSIWLATVDADTSRAAVVSGLVLLGCGLGLTMRMAVVIVQNSVEIRDLGAATGVSTLFRTIGGSLGVAAFGSILNRAVAQSPGEEPAAIANGVGLIFLTSAFVCAAGFVAACLIREVPLSEGSPVSSVAAVG